VTRPATNNHRKVGSYRDLLVWQKGIVLVKSVYLISQGFPNDERYGLTAQIRRAAISIPSNIAEGQARHTTKEFIVGISHAEGSLAELDTQLVLAVELGYCPQADNQSVFDSIVELRRMLNGLRRKLQEK
jgi:four helix bundle protein